MSRPREIYLDLDDVLNTFTNYALRFRGAKPPEYSDWPACDFDIVANAARFGLKTTAQQFWRGLPQEVWATVPKSNICNALIDVCARLVGKDNVFIATSPVMDGGSHAGKYEWIVANTPSWLHRQYFITPRKWKLSQPGSLLIDDSDENVEKWRRRGGLALTCPRPWNSLRGNLVGPSITCGLTDIFYGG